MVKRKQWKKTEDEKLKKVIKNEKRQIIWEVISHKLKKLGITKSSKQCRERWIHQLHPSVKKKKWENFENKKLFYFFKKKGNKWKMISDEFKGRTDNSIKNNFFSLIRKSLRLACKILGKKRNTNRINKIKGSVLTIFMKTKIFIDFQEIENYEDKGFFGGKNRNLGNFEKNDFLENLGKNYFGKDEERNVIDYGKFDLDFKDIEKNEKIEKEKKLDFDFQKNEENNFDVEKKEEKNLEKKKIFDFEKNKKMVIFDIDTNRLVIEVDKFIEKLAFSNFKEIYNKMNKKDFFVLNKIISDLFELDKKITEKKNLKKLKKKNIENFKILKSSSKSEIFISEESKLEENENISNSEKNENILNSDNLRNKKISKKNPEKNINFYSKIIYNCINKEKSIKSKYSNNLLKLKKKLILNFQNIKKYSDIIINKLLKEKNFIENEENSKNIENEEIEENQKNIENENLLFFENEKIIEEKKKLTNNKIFYEKNNFSKNEKNDFIKIGESFGIKNDDIKNKIF